MSGLKCCVLSGASFTVIPVANYNPLKASFLVITCCGWDGVPLSSNGVLDLVGFSIRCVDCTNEHVIRDVIEMAAIFEPRASHYESISCGSPQQEISLTRDVVRCGFPFSFDQDRNIGSVFAVPGLKSCKDL